MKTIDNKLLNSQKYITSDLLSENVIFSKIFIFFSIILKNKYTHKNMIDLDVSYDNFKKIIKELVILIMESYLIDTKYENDKCLCEIYKMGIYSGYYDRENNLIALSENSVYRIYQGDILELRVLFHELNHFKIEYNIKLDKNDDNINRIIKEKLLRKCYPSYYMDNYEYESEEKFVDILAELDLLTFINISKINISKKDITKIKNTLSINKEKYYSYGRNTESLDIIDNYLDFRKAFDFLIPNHPEWLEYSQIKKEYCLNNNEIIKKNSFQKK